MIRTPQEIQKDLARAHRDQDQDRDRLSEELKHSQAHWDRLRLSGMLGVDTHTPRSYTVHNS